jgi:hypothetical protein
MALIGRIMQASPSVAVLAIGLVAMRLALGGAPAVDPAARQVGLYVDWRVPDGRALYIAPEYLYQLGYGYLQADVYPSSATEAPGEVADAATAEARAQQAEVLFTESLQLAPGSARTWASLAWARALGGDLAGAEDALLVSWGLAPWSGNLAVERYALADMLQQIDPTRSSASAEWQDALARDLDMLTRWDSRALITLDSDPDVTGE